jgi:hypothetical protein
MNLTEDRLRAALTQTAEQIPRGSIPPLRFPPDAKAPVGPDTPTAWIGAARRRIKIMAVPAAAAVAVVAVIASSLVLAGGPHRPRQLTAGSAGLLDRVPQYYMELRPTKPGSADDEAVIRDTRTGATVATVRPPSPFTTFSLLAGARDDRTFVLAARRAVGRFVLTPTRLYSARFNPAARSIGLTALPVPRFPANAPVNGLAISPSGTELAVALAAFSGHVLQVVRPQIRIYPLSFSQTAGSPAKVWRAPRGSGYIFWNTSNLPLLPADISWARTGALAFSWQSSTSAPTGIRLLDTSTSGGSLLGDSRQVVANPTNGNTWEDDILTTNGATIAAVFTGGGITAPLNASPPAYVAHKFEEFSAATGRLTRTMWPTSELQQYALEDSIFWSNSSGSVLVVLAPPTRGRQPGKPKPVLGVLRGNKFVPLPSAAVTTSSLLAF